MDDIEMKLATAGAQTKELADELRDAATQVAARHGDLGTRLEDLLAELSRCGEQLQMVATEWHGRS